jgi:hypothetical protein
MAVAMELVPQAKPDRLRKRFGRGGEKWRGFPAAKTPEKENRAEDADNCDDALRCAHCGHIITRQGQAITVASAHEHTVVNPAGVLFAIRLFRSAPGCRFQGAPSGEFSWFPGYLWRLAFCGGCGQHLGWLFQGEGDQFVALIAGAIREEG